MILHRLLLSSTSRKENVIIGCIVNNDDVVADDQFVKSTPPTNFRVGEVDASSDMYNVNLKNPSNEEVIITTTVQTETPRRRSNFKLGDVDVKTINITRKEQTDHIIGVAHSVLHRQFPEAEGLENTTLGPCSNFTIHEGEFLQILHTSKHHWVLVSNIGCKPSTINLYDSLFNGRMTSHVKKQIASLLMEKGPTIAVNIQPVHQQPNVVDCGVFAIAFLVAILFKQDPSQITFRECGTLFQLQSYKSHGIWYPNA